MRNNYILLTAALLLAGTTAFAQSNSFAYRRKLTATTKDGWHTLIVPVDALGHTQPSYSDLRLYTYNGSDTTEVPYLLKVRNDVTTTKELQLSQLNESRKGDDLYVTFELPPNESVNYLDLTFDKPDFEATAALEGSSDQKTWFSILSAHRIVSIKNDRVDFQATTLDFAETNYHYLRLTIKSQPKISLVKASFLKRGNVRGVFHSIPNRLATEQLKTDKRTQVDITLDQYQPITKLSLSIANDGDFYRPFTLEALSDSAESEKGWIYYYNNIHEGFLTSVRPNDFTFSSINTRKLRLTIDNADNPPLKVQLAAAYGARVEMIAKLKPGTEYYLVYGSKAAGTPQYDLVHFEKQIPDQRDSVLTEAEEFIGKEHTHGSPLIESKAWLWGIMVLVIGVLGYFTLRMMKTKA